MFAAATDVKSSNCTRKSHALLISFFVVGYLAGRGIVNSDSLLYASLISQAVRSTSLGFGLFLCTLFPVLISTLIFITRRTELFVLQCILQSFFYGVVSGSIELAFGPMCWLISLFLQSSSTITLIALLYFWFRLIPGKGINAKNDLWFCYFVSFLAFILDFFWISPFVTNLSFI